jgi:integrase/recombinase XerC
MPFGEFLQYLQTQKRVSSHTTLSYRTDLENFFEYLNQSYEVSRPEEVTTLMVRSWMAHLMETGLETSSVNRKLSALRSFYKFLLKQGSIVNNPLKKVQGPKNKKRLPVFVDETRMEKLFEADQEENSFTVSLEEAIVELFYATGIRLSEMIELKKNHFYGNAIKVLGKRNKERILPLTQAAIDAMEKYNAEREKLDFIADDTHFFVNEKGNKLYQKFVYRLINRYLSKVTTDKKRSPHVLRHTFATHMLNNGAELNAVKEMLGHASLAATQVYTHNTINKLINIHQKAHPFERKAS